jgi:DNA-binding XRE family transcriptional regulator
VLNSRSAPIRILVPDSPISPRLLVSRKRFVQALAFVKCLASVSKITLTARTRMCKPSQKDTHEMKERGLEQPNARFIPLLARAVNVPTTALLVGEGRNPGLIELRVARGLSGVELAEAAGLSKMTYYRLEQGVGTRTPDRHALSALASALGVPIDDVVGAIVQTRAARGVAPARD